MSPSRSCGREQRSARSATSTRARWPRSGGRAAVAEIGPLRFTGFLGWLVWLVVHLYYLIGFENRLLVMVRWSWYYFRYDRPVRSIVRADPPRSEH